MTASAFGCSTQKTNQDIPELMEPQNIEVSTVRVERADIRVYSVETSRVEPQGVNVCFDKDGTVAKVYVEQGQYVEKGTLLAELSVEEYDEEIPKLEQQLADLLENFEKENKQRDKREAEIANNIARLKREVRQTSGDARNQKRMQLEIAEIEQERFNVDKENRLKQQQDQEAELREKIDELNEMKGTNRLYAPVSGCVLNQPMNLIDERFHKDDTVFVLYDPDELYISAKYYTEAKFEKMYEHYAVINGQQVDLSYIDLTDEQLKQLSVKSVPGSTVSKRVQYHVNPQSGQEVNMGDYALVVFVTDYRENVLTLPADMVRYDGHGYHVFKYEDGVRKEVEIIPGLRDKCRVEILSGLEEGDIIYAQY